MNNAHSISSLARKLAAAGAAAALGALSLVGLGPIDAAGAATVAFDLCATTGSASFPSGTTSITPVSFWGYAPVDLAGCGAATVAHPGGPTLVVSQGDVVTINLHNNLAEPTSLDIGGQALASDVTGTGPASTKSYTFTATRAGTYLYQAGLTANGPQEVALGLYGALVVRPATAGQAYDDAGSAYDVESVLVLGELDPALTPANYAGFDMRNYAPKWGLINGLPYPSTAPIPASADDTVLLRYLNTGSFAHSMSVLGANQTQLATDGHRLPADRHFVAETFGPGETADVLVHVPTTAAAGTKLMVFDGGISLFNNGKKTNLATARSLGGMMTFIEVGTSTGTPGGPFTNTMAFTGGILTATIDDTDAGGDNVAAAEYFVDSVGANGSGTALDAVDATFNDAVTEPVTSTTPLALALGAHTLFVHGQDSVGNWGPMAALVVTVTAADTTGPAASAATVTPATTNHTPNTVTAAVAATVDDGATGGGVVDAAEYFIDSAGPDGTGTAMAVSPAGAVVVSADGTIDNATLAGLTEGTHTVLVHGRDLAGNWGAAAPAPLVIDRTGPSATGVSASPNPNNGTVPVNTSTPAVRVSGITSDVSANGSTIVAAELFLCSALDNGANPGCNPGATGTGVAMIVSDGAWDEVSEPVYGDIPLTTVNTLSVGSHTIWVRARDAAGNWGPAVATALVIDKTAPTFTGITVSPTLVLVPPGTTTLTLAGATDGANGTGVAGGEYWFTTTAPAVGAGTPFTGTAPVLNLSSLAPGNYTIRVRIRDAAFNWSTGTGGIRTATLTVAPDPIFANGFETGNRPWGWTSASTTTTNRLDVTATAALVGTRGLQARGNAANYVQYNFGAVANPASGAVDAAFSFDPNGNASTGQDIFRAAAATSNASFNAPVIRIRYRNNAGVLQVQAQIGSVANPAWVPISDAPHRLEVTWEAGTLTLYVDGVQSQTLSGTAASISAFRLGSIASGGSNVFMYFDAFSAKRSVAPLIG